MQKKTLLFKSNYQKVLSLVLVLCSLIFLSSCNNDSKKEPGKEPTTSQIAAQMFKMNCVTITKAQVQTWVDSGWTNPANPNKIKTILLQFYSGSAADANSNMQLISYPGKSATDVKITGKQILNIDTSCVAKELTGPVIFGNNIVSIADLKILKPDGTLNDFDYIRFVPAQNYPPYVNFKIEIVRLGIAEILVGGGSWPCPPYCGITGE